MALALLEERSAGVSICHLQTAIEAYLAEEESEPPLALVA
jgi:hypothetical protein